MIKYIGSKRLLVPDIVEIVRRCKGVRSVVDLFSGTSRVGHALKAEGFRVVANDHNSYAATLARCYVQADGSDVGRDAVRLIREFSRLKGRHGYFTESFCIKSRFFQPKNGERVDAIRESIARKCLEPNLEAVVLVSLMEAADRVDSTTGIQMSYLKQWSPRSYNDLELRLPELLERGPYGRCESCEMDAMDAAGVLKADMFYVDPPYNQHKYLGNYHIWETLVRWDKPELYGVGCKRVDCRTRASMFNSRPKSHGAMEDLISRIQAKYILVSFSNEGFISKEQMESILGRKGDVVVLEKDFKRYVGAQIGICGPDGRKVGKVSHLRNKEYLYLVKVDRRRVLRRRRSLEAHGHEKTTLG